MTRAAVAEALDEDFIRAARAKGVREKRVMRRHALRAALPPVIGLVSVTVALMVSNVILIEPAFRLPGFFRQADIGQFRGEQSHVPSLGGRAGAHPRGGAAHLGDDVPRRPPAGQDRPAGDRAKLGRRQTGVAPPARCGNTAAQSHGPGRRRQGVQPCRPPALPREGAHLPGRLRAHAGRRALRGGARLVRPGDRAQPDRRRRPAGAGQRRGARGDRRPRLPDRARAVQHRDQHRAAAVRRGGLRRARGADPREPQPRRGALAHRRRAHGDHRDPADDRRRAPQRERAQRQPALRAAQRADLRRPRGGPRDRHPRRRAAVDLRRHDRARGGVHQRPAAPAGRARRVRRALERRAGDRRRAGRHRRQRALLLRQGAVARDAHRALRAGDRHAARRAQGPGRAPARVVRRALDHVDLRPVRGERPLLPGPAAGVRGRGPGRDPRRAATSPSCPSCGCTTGRSTAGTARSTTSCAAARTCASRTGSCPPARRWSTSSPTPPSTTAWCRC